MTKSAQCESQEEEEDKDDNDTHDDSYGAGTRSAMAPGKVSPKTEVGMVRTRLHKKVLLKHRRAAVVVDVHGVALAVGAAVPLQLHVDGVLEFGFVGFGSLGRPRPARRVDDGVAAVGGPEFAQSLAENTI